MNSLLVLAAILLVLRYLDSTMLKALLIIGLMIYYYATSSDSPGAAFLKILFLLCAVGGAVCIPALGIGWGVMIALSLFVGVCTALHLYTRHVGKRDGKEA